MSYNFIKYVNLLKHLQEKISVAHNLHIVLGNDAADLDSIVSALCFSFIKYLEHETDNIIYLPLCNLYKADVNLRTEVIYWLKQCNINVEQLLYIDDIDLQNFTASNKLHLTLVDHNNISCKYEHLVDCVDCIIDHHDLEFSSNKYKLLCEDDCVIEPVGSCSTLVAEKIFTFVAKQPKFIDLVDSSVYKLLYGAILLDTVCLSGERGRCTSKDIDIVTQLECKLGLDSSQRQEMFEKLQCGKFNITELCNRDLLRKDLKVVVVDDLRVGIASIAGLDFEVLFRRPVHGEQFSKDCSKFSIENGYHLLVVMTIGEHDSGDSESQKTFRRGLIVQSKDNLFGDELVKYLVSHSLELSRSYISSSQIEAFHQHNLKASRKVVLPLVRHFLENYKSN